MATTSVPRQPAYRWYKPKNLAVVRIDGRDRYLGEYDSPASWQRYYRLLAERKANGSVDTELRPDPDSGFIGVATIVEGYLKFAERYYAKNDPLGKEVSNIKYAIEPLCKLYGLADANKFGPKSLKFVREHMIGLNWSRKLINARVNLIKRCFKWAIAEELISPNVLLGLQEVQGLRYGRSAARETEPVLLAFFTP